MEGVHDHFPGSLGLLHADGFKGLQVGGQGSVPSSLGLALQCAGRPDDRDWLDFQRAEPTGARQRSRRRSKAVEGQTNLTLLT